MFHVFRAEFFRAPYRGWRAPWLAGKGKRVTAHQVTPSTHVCYLSGLIGGTTHWMLSSSDSFLLMRPRTAPKSVWEMMERNPEPT